MYCSQCGEKNNEEATFCAKCGGKVNAGAGVPSKEIAKDAVKEIIKEEVGGFFSKKTVDSLQTSWKKFSIDEKIIAVGAAAVLMGFFLPWVKTSFSLENVNGIEMAQETTKWFYAFLVLAFASLAMLFLGRNKTAVRKALSFQSQTIIGTFIASMGLLTVFTVEDSIYFQGEIGAGWWMITFGGIAILTGALRAQKYFLRNITNNK
ncbi:MAG: zinc-ribbon domain-containing protein [Candidatus Paceibacterota bacterium]